MNDSRNPYPPANHHLYPDDALGACRSIVMTAGIEVSTY